MDGIIPLVQIIVSVLLILAVLLQQRGTGTGAIFGGGNEVFRAKRGPEKTLHYITITLAIIFFALGLYQTIFLK